MEIAATIVAMGHILGFKVLAEGVETMEQLAFLQEKTATCFKALSEASRCRTMSLPGYCAIDREANNEI